MLVGQGYSDTVKWLGNPLGKMILNRDVFDEWFNSNKLIKDPAWNDKFLAGFPKNNHVFFILDTFQEAFQEVAGVLLLLLGCGNRKSGETRSSRKFRVMKNGVSDGWTGEPYQIWKFLQTKLPGIFVCAGWKKLKERIINSNTENQGWLIHICSSFN